MRSDTLVAGPDAPGNGLRLALGLAPDVCTRVSRLRERIVKGIPDALRFVRGRS